VARALTNRESRTRRVSFEALQGAHTEFVAYVGVSLLTNQPVTGQGLVTAAVAGAVAGVIGPGVVLALGGEGLGAFVLGGAIGGMAGGETQCIVGQLTGGERCTPERMGFLMASGATFGAFGGTADYGVDAEFGGTAAQYFVTRAQGTWIGACESWLESHVFPHLP
jgi:hypothetical protein